MGVNLDAKKAHLYKTFGADYYRRNLKSIVKGNSQLEKDFNNANEVMKIESNAFPEFENYVVNDYNKNQINISLLNNLPIDLNTNVNNPDNFIKIQITMKIIIIYKLQKKIILNQLKMKKKKKKEKMTI